VIEKNVISLTKKESELPLCFLYKEYEELLENLHDLAIVAERRDEPTVSFEEIKKKLKADGLL